MMSEDIGKAAKAAEFADEKFVAEFPGAAEVARASPDWSKAIAFAVLQAIRWRDIETAPKDGTEIVLLDANVKTASVGHWMTERKWAELGAAKPVPTWFPLASPTHWMPLPAPPKASEAV